MKNAAGDWAARDDVWIWYFDRQGPLTVGYGAREDLIGPELGFGCVMGDACDEPVLLIKIAWGGKSLAKDFRPPSSGGRSVRTTANYSSISETYYLIGAAMGEAMKKLCEE